VSKATKKNFIFTKCEWVKSRASVQEEEKEIFPA
jgi:hypothetical protein